MATVTETKKKTVRINGCVASAQAAKYADVDVITAYPIRPYTATMMALAQMVANGELDAEYIVADSEHSQLSIAHGASSSGARVFTGQLRRRRAVCVRALFAHLGQPHAGADDDCRPHARSARAISAPSIPTRFRRATWDGSWAGRATPRKRSTIT